MKWEKWEELLRDTRTGVHGPRSTQNHRDGGQIGKGMARVKPGSGRQHYVE